MHTEQRKKRVVFTGGGTGGHVFPGLAAINAMPTGVAVHWIASIGGMEEEILRRHAIPFFVIPAGKLRRNFSVRQLFEVFFIIAGFLCSLYYLLRLRPNIIISKGGFVSVPVIFAGFCLGIKIIQHESDYQPGLATRICMPLAQRICLSWQDTIQFLPARVRNRAVFTGNPVRTSLKRGRKCWKTAGYPCIAVIGGSSGAAELNALVDVLYKRINKGTTLLHQYGRSYVPQYRGDNYIAREFFYEEDYACMLASADIVICRAGAGMLSELAVLAKPAIIIPLFAEVSRGEQLVNARCYAENGAAKVLVHPDAEQIWRSVSECLSNPELLRSMSSAAKVQSYPAAAQKLADLVMSEI